MRRIIFLMCLSATLIGTVSRAEAQLQIRAVATGLLMPTSITHAPDNSGRLFVTLQPGRIVIIRGNQPVTTFLDISTLVSCCGERGLLSVAFHPNYAANGVFFVDYTDVNGNTAIARYRVSPNPDLADPATAEIILRVRQPFANHNGGQLQFGPDGMLYIGMGDGGSGGDPGNRAQNLGLLLGKMLRINVNGARSYSIPPDNPFLNNPTARREIWAMGLRNPWRFSFDRLTGGLFIGDVGQNRFEEVNFQPAFAGGGQNYGWRLMEGKHCFNPAVNCNPGNLVLPIIEYPHPDGCSITGGYVYRGNGIPGLRGTYLYADLCNGRISGARRQRGGAWVSTLLLATTFTITTFGENQNGEIFFADYNGGGIFRIIGLL